MDKTSEIVVDSVQLGLLIKNRRQSMNITQQQVAKYCNLSHTGIGKIENGLTDVKLSTLIKLFKILGIKIQINFES